MSAAVDADLARYERDRESEEARAEEIERLAADYLSDPAKLGEAVTWCDHGTADHRRVLLHVGALIRAAMDYTNGRGSAIGSLVTLTNSGIALAADKSFAQALERLAERAVSDRERYPDAND